MNNIWQHIKDFFHAAEDVVAAAVKAFAAFIEANGGDVLVQSALDAVTAAEAAAGTGAEKFAAAVAAVKSDLTTKGITVVEHAVQSAVLAAVSKLKADATPAIVADPAPEAPAAEASATDTPTAG